jgi:hypothetical protein
LGACASFSGPSEKHGLYLSGCVPGGGQQPNGAILAILRQCRRWWECEPLP